MWKCGCNLKNPGTRPKTVAMRRRTSFVPSSCVPLLLPTEKVHLRSEIARSLAGLISAGVLCFSFWFFVFNSILLQPRYKRNSKQICPVPLITAEHLPASGSGPAEQRAEFCQLSLKQKLLGRIQSHFTARSFRVRLRTFSRIQTCKLA